MNDYGPHSSYGAQGPVQQPVPYGFQHPVPPGAPQQKQRNVVGTVALITAIVGFIFACIPSLSVIGWVLLPVAFILSIVGLALSGKTKGTSIAGLIISIVGTITGFVVFFAGLGSAFDDAFGGSDVEISSPEDGGSADPDAGSRNNPVQLGTTISSRDWDITIISFDRDMTKEVLAANQFNDEPAEGKAYAIVEAEATYKGEDTGLAWVDVSFAYITESGNTITVGDSMAVAPDPRFNDIGELYEGASGRGNVVLEVPEGDNGLLRVSAGFIADDVFILTE